MDFEILSASEDEDDDISVTDLMVKLTEFMATVPDEVRDSVFIRLSVRGEYARGDLSFMRHETEAERLAHEAAERDRTARYAAEAAAREFREFERLKAKFGV